MISTKHVPIFFALEYDKMPIIILITLYYHYSEILNIIKIFGNTDEENHSACAGLRVDLSYDSAELNTTMYLN